MTEKLYYKNSYEKEFEGIVLESRLVGDEYHILLNRTAFFPTGGGQTCDTGVLNHISVLSVYEINQKVYHVIQQNLAVGTKVYGKIDFEERFSKMQQHTGEHIVSGLIHRNYGFENVGFHLGRDYVSMDFNGNLTMKEIREIEKAANQVVTKNIPIQTYFPTEQELAQLQYRSKKEVKGQVRIVEIAGFDCCACCAPHVSSTGEIGIIKLTKMEKYKSGVRIYLLCGLLAQRDYQEKEEIIHQLSVLLSSKPEELFACVSKWKDEIYHLNGRIQQLEENEVRNEVNKIPSDSKCSLYFSTQCSLITLRSFVNMAMEKSKGICGAFLGNDTDGYQYILGSSECDMKTIGKNLSSVLCGKGGGKKEMIQGFLPAKEEDIRSYFVEFFRKKSCD